MKKKQPFHLWIIRGTTKGSANRHARKSIQTSLKDRKKGSAFRDRQKAKIYYNEYNQEKNSWKPNKKNMKFYKLMGNRFWYLNNLKIRIKKQKSNK